MNSFWTSKFVRVLLLTTLFFLPSLVSGEESFKSTDADGNVHYSTTPPEKDAAPTTLPKLQREDLDEKIEAIRAATPENCIGHGGVDCAKGADEDGSVICLDGFRDAVLPFQFRCSEARLEVNQVALFDPINAELLELSKKNSSLPASTDVFLILRNSASVEAQKIRVRFDLPDYHRLNAEGPRTIEAFGVGEYSLPLAVVRGARALEFEVSCANCRTFRRRVKW